MLESWQNLSELEAPGPVQNTDESPIADVRSLEDEISSHPRSNSYYQRPGDGEDRLGGPPDGDHRSTDGDSDEYSASPEVNNLTEMASGAVDENPDERRRYSHHSLEDRLGPGLPRPSQRTPRPEQVGRVQTNVFISAHLVVFSILGTLARLGLTALTAYPAQPIRFKSIWPNFAGSLILGFLVEGAELLHHPPASRRISGPSPAAGNRAPPRSPPTGAEVSEGDEQEKNRAPTSSAVPVPLHLGLAAGFCGSFTSYSAFMRDCFSALAGTVGRSSPGQDFMSVAAVIIITLALSLAGLKCGAHVAILLMACEKRLPRRLLRALDRVAVVLGVGLWVGAVVMAIVPPDRHSGHAGATKAREQETWRGQVLFALVFAPVGCLLRFVVSIKLNTRVVGFPLGTFCVNMFGSLLLAVLWDLQRLPRHGTVANIGGNLVSCQVLQGIEDGFCGCLTTVSTWILELSTLRRRHAYQYGLATVVTGLGIVVTVMGSLKWTIGLSQPACISI